MVPYAPAQPEYKCAQATLWPRGAGGREEKDGILFAHPYA
jgi:hypothetical protein